MAPFWGCEKIPLCVPKVRTEQKSRQLRVRQKLQPQKISTEFFCQNTFYKFPNKILRKIFFHPPHALRIMFCVVPILTRTFSYKLQNEAAKKSSLNLPPFCNILHHSILGYYWNSDADFMKAKFKLDFSRCKQVFDENWSAHVMQLLLLQEKKQVQFTSNLLSNKPGCLSASKPRILIIQVCLHFFAIWIFHTPITNKV